MVMISVEDFVGCVALLALFFIALLCALHSSLVFIFDDVVVFVVIFAAVVVFSESSLFAKVLRRHRCHPMAVVISLVLSSPLKVGGSTVLTTIESWGCCSFIILGSWGR